MGQGNAPNWCAEFNFFIDATSAKKFFQIFQNITMISYELCHDYYISLNEDQRAQIFDQNTPLSNMIRDVYRVCLKTEGGFYPVYD